MNRSRTAALLLLVLTACPGRDPAPARTPGASPPPGIRGGTLRVLLAEDINAIDPQRAAAPSSFGLARAMHRGLMAFPAASGAEGSQPVPDLAEDVPQISADGLRYTFRLRAGPGFGAPASRAVRAADVKAGLERVFTARSPFARYYRVIAGAGALESGRASGLSGVAAPDERTVVVTLARPSNDLLWLLALPAASAVPPGLAPTARPKDISPSGPYRLAGDGYVPERTIHLIRNDAWSEATDPIRRALVDDIRYEIGLAPAEIADRIASGRAHLAGDALPAGTRVTGIPGDRIVREPQGCLRYLFMNTRVAPFTSGRVRAGVAAALNRSAVAATYGPAGAAPAATILPPTVSGHDPARPVPSANPREAHRILSEAGYGGVFSVRLVVGDTKLDRDQAVAVRDALRPAGVRVTISVVPIASLYEDHYEVPAARVPMGIATWCADWPGLGGRGALAALVDGRGVTARGNTNYSGVHDRGLERAMDLAATERDPARATAAWLACDRRATATAAVVPLAHPAETNLLGANLRGFVAHPFFVRGDLTAVWINPS